MKRITFVRNRNHTSQVRGYSQWRWTAHTHSWLLAMSMMFVLSVVAKADGAAAARPGTSGVLQPSAQGWADTHTGAAQASYPFQLLPARGSVQPDLTLNYSSSAASIVREAGIAWGFDLPTIEIVSAQGGDPRREYFASAGRDARVSFNGAPLLAIGDGTSLTVKRIDGSEERLPDWATGWRYYRLHNDSSHSRFFWSPDKLTWKVESPDGEILELGKPITPGLTLGTAIEWIQQTPFRWRVVLRYDAHGGVKPNNVVRYDWDGVQALVPIAIHDTLDRDRNFTHHTLLDYEANDSAPRDLSTISQAPPWGARPFRRLKSVEVRNNAQVVRRYHLAYETMMHRSFLHSITEEGACSEANCPTLAPTTFSYTRPLDHFEFRKISTPSGIESPFGRLNNTAFVDADRDGISDIVMDSTVLYQTHVKYPPLGRPEVRLERHSVENSRMDEYANDQLFNRDTGLALPYPRDALKGDSLIYIKDNDRPGLLGVRIWSDVRVPTGLQWHMGLRVGTYVSPWLGDLVVTGDIDGNGTTDILSRDGEHGAPRQHLYSRFQWAIRDGAGGYPVVPAPGMMPAESGAGNPYRTSVPFYTLADMNGDNFVDLVTLADSPYSSDQPFIYFPGDGTGKFACDNAEICSLPPTCEHQPYDVNWCTTPRVALGPSAPRHPQQSPESNFGLVFADVNQDGLSDIIRPEYVVPPDSRTILHIWINDDGVNFHQEPDVVDPLYGALSLVTTDIDGDGVSDIVLMGPTQIGYFKRRSTSDLRVDDYPGLLKSIDNGIGGNTRFNYSAIAELDQDAAEHGQPWRTHSPQPTQVVNSVFTQQSGTDGDNESSVTYSYRDPFYDPLEARIVGFRQVDEDHVDRSLLNLNAYRISTRYAYPCETGFCPNGSEVSDYHGLIGVPYEVDITAGRGSIEARSTTLYRYHSVSTHRELNPTHNPEATPVRKAAFTYASSTDTYLYDTAPFTAERSNLGNLPLTRDGVGPATDVVVLPSTHREHLRTEQDRDIYGNLVQARDYGRVGDNGQSDSVITTSYDYEAIGAPQRYMFRVRHETTSGFGARPGLPTDPDRRVEYQYNDPANPGDVTDVIATLTGTLPLARTHERIGHPNVKIADPPSSASVDGAVRVSHLEYDPYGNIVRTHGPNQTSCVSIVYDPETNHLPKMAKRHVKACAPEGALVESTTYDPRLELPTFISKADGSVKLLGYDAFGRINSSTDNDPDIVGVPSSQSTSIQYFESAAKATQATKMTLPVAPGQLRTIWQYADAFGNAKGRVVQADADDGQGAPWVVESAVKQFIGPATPFASYRPFGSTTDPAQLEFTYPAAVDATMTYYLGRVVLQSNRGRRVQFAYHPLSVDVSDEEDMAGGVHANTPMTKVYDGHGRLIRSTVRNKAAGGTDEIHTDYDYNVAGQVLRITKRHSQGGETFVRWMQYDSLGRLVLNAEPNTAKNFTADAQSAAALTTMRAWRYAYDDAGRTVGTSDARGCGKNLSYDSLGRLLAEDYSPCMAHHERYTPLKLEEGKGAEVLYQYNPLGQLTAVADRGSLAQFTYDARGRAKEAARRLTRPASEGGLDDLDFGGLDIKLGVGIHIEIGGGGGDAGAGSNGDARYAEHWFRKAFRYDLADRLVSEDTGADIPELLVNGKSTVDYAYTARGFPKNTTSSYGPLVAAMTYNADGTRDMLKLADAAGTAQKLTYGPHDVTRYLVSREGPPLWRKATSNYTPADANVPSSLQTVLADLQFVYDGVGNPTEIKDARDPNEWPAGARPKSQTLTYDDLYRLTEEKAEYNAPNKVDPQVSPFAAEEADPFSRGILPRLVRAKRSTAMQVGYDFLGNTTAINDNDSTVLDRAALGAVVNGDLEGHPNRLTGSALGTQVAYDPAGNVVEMLVPRTGECSSDKCSHHFIYNWDEVGQLVRARRWDYEEIPANEARYPELPFGSPEVDVRYAYTQGGRVLKSVKPRGRIEKHSAEIFDSLRLDNTDWFIDDYESDAASQSVYAGGAHVVMTEEDLPATEDSAPMSSARRHVFLSLGDTLGSTSLVIDRDTGELAEAVQYHPFGTVDSDYRPERWGNHREPYQFTGKETDSEVGLTYFGSRYYAASLGRWMSADPLTVHNGESNLNPYAYVGGSVTRMVDPLGLDVCDRDRGSCIPSPGSPPPPDPGGPPPIDTSPPTGGASGQSMHGHADVRPISGRAQGTRAIRWLLKAQSDWSRGSFERTAEMVKDTFSLMMRVSAIDALSFGTITKFTDAKLDAAFHKFATPESKQGVMFILGGSAAELASVLIGIGEVSGGRRVLVAIEGYCFAEGTPVLTCDNVEKSIESLREGDTVLSRNELTGELECQQITRTFERTADDLVTLTWSSVDRSTRDALSVTGGHPFWIVGKGWVPARALERGDEGFSASGHRVVLTDTSPDHRAQRVFNLEVEQNHTYFVGNSRVLTHNTCILAAEEAAVLLPKGRAAFKTFEEFKAVFGEVGPDFQWHHIVEQRAANVERFGAEMIHATDNLIPVEVSVHQRINGYYSSIQDFTGGQTVRKWLQSKSFQEQHDFGVKVLKMFGGAP